MQLRESLIHELKPEDVRTFLGLHKTILVAVLKLPVLKRCHDFVPEFEKIAGNLEYANIECAQVNALGCGRTLDGCFGALSTFFCLILCEGLSKAHRYHGPFTKPDIMFWLERFLKFPVETEVTASSLSAFQKCSSVVVVAYMRENDYQWRNSFFVLAVTLYPEFLFGVSYDSELARREGVSMPGMAASARNGTEKTILPMMPDIQAATATLRKIARPLIADLMYEIHDCTLNVENPIGYILVASQSERAIYSELLQSMANRLHGKIQVCVNDPTALDILAEDSAINITSLSVFVIRWPVMSLRYPIDRSPSHLGAEVEAFLQDYLGRESNLMLRKGTNAGKTY